MVISVRDIDINLLTKEPFRGEYLNFIIDTAEINECFQQVELIYDCITFLNKYNPEFGSAIRELEKLIILMVEI